MAHGSRQPSRCAESAIVLALAVACLALTAAPAAARHHRHYHRYRYHYQHRVVPRPTPKVEPQPTPAVKPVAVVGNPRAIVVDIYKVEEGKTGTSAFEDARIRTLYFSKSLLAAVTQMEQKGKATSIAILGFDPITNSPDPHVKDLSITDEKVTADKATVAASFWTYNEKQPSIIRYDFIKQGGAWKLDEIRGENDNDKKSPFWSLRAIIQGS